jgi:hypothetical protein
VGAWFIIQPIFPGFCLTSLIFSTTLWIQLGLPHPSNTIIPWCLCHTSHQPYGYPLHTLCSWQWTHKNPWCSSWHLCYHCIGCWFPRGCKNNYMRFLQTRSILLVNESTLCSPKMAFTPESMLSLLTQHKWIYFFNLVPPKDLLLPMRLKPNNRVIVTNTMLINSSP